MSPEDAVGTTRHDVEGGVRGKRVARDRTRVRERARGRSWAALEIATDVGRGVRESYTGVEGRARERSDKLAMMEMGLPQQIPNRKTHGALATSSDPRQRKKADAEKLLED